MARRFTLSVIVEMVCRDTCALMTQVIGDLPIQGGLQQPLGQLLQHPALPGQLQPTGLGTIDQITGGPDRWEVIRVESPPDGNAATQWEREHFSLPRRYQAFESARGCSGPVRGHRSAGPAGLRAATRLPGTPSVARLPAGARQPPEFT